MRTNKILVSVIVPMYNSKKTIERCIISILTQTYQNFEIVIIDNGSTDNSYDAIRHIEDKRIRYVRTSKKGVGAARNIGIRESVGEYVSFCDADDEYASTFLESMVNSAISNDVNIVKCGVTKIGPNSKSIEECLYGLDGKIFSTKNKNEAEMLYNLFFRDNHNQIQCTAPSLFIKKDVLIQNNIAFDETVCMMEDVLFYADLFKTGERVFFLGASLYHYKYNPDSATHAKNNYKKIVDGAILSCAKLHQRLGEDPDMDIKYLRIVFHYMDCEYSANGNFYIPEKLKDIAERASMSSNNRLWSAIAIVIANKRLSQIRILFRLRRLRLKIKNSAMILHKEEIAQ